MPRTERDSLGPVEVPDSVMYGASTHRATCVFPTKGHQLPPLFIRTVGLLKYACAVANVKLGKMPKDKGDLLMQAAMEVYEGKLDAHFPLDVFQTGSATSTNMNVNEVVANRCSQLAGEPLGSKKPVHTNDDVNMGQSSNDTMPTVLHVSVALALHHELIPALRHLHAALAAKAQEFNDVIKIGRTHLMDATPLSLGQEFSGYARQMEKAIARAEHALGIVMELAIGGTAVGTGINSHPDFSPLVLEVFREKTGLPFVEARNHFEAQAARDDCVEVAGILATIGASMTKIANDIRLLASGPRSGIGELILPATQPGSSIMPGKVNPVQCEMVVQVGLYVIGLAQVVMGCGRDGHFELNVTIPLMAYSILDAVRCISQVAIVFTDRCIVGIQPDLERCKELVDRSLMLVTALNPYIGYDKAAAVAKKAHAEGKTLREVVLEEGLMDAATLDKALDPRSMITPEGNGPKSKL